MLNSGIAADATGSAVGRYVVLLAAASSVFLRSRPAVSHSVGYVLLFGAFAVLHSIFFSPAADVSVLKAVSWTLAFSTILTAWSELGAQESNILEKEIFGSLILLMVVSLPLLVTPLGYMRNGTGFQGVLNHPQAFGPTMALLGVWTMSRWLTGTGKRVWLYLALAVGCIGLVVSSEARTAGFAMVLGIILATITVVLLSECPLRESLPNLGSYRMFIVIIVTSLCAVFAGQEISDRYTDYLAKRGKVNVESLADAYQKSRGGLAQGMWMNIQNDPVVGIGFGIASDPSSMKIIREPLFGLPVSAVIEKGILPLAVWEELGLIGLGLFVGLVLLFLRRGIKAGLGALSVGMTAFLLNLGESTFFSPGGMGLLSLILFGWVVSSARHQFVQRC